MVTVESNQRTSNTDTAWLNFFAVAALAALGLVLITAPGNAQTVIEKERFTKQKEISMLHLDAAQIATVPDATTTEIRPFHINVPEDALVDLRRRIAATKWPEAETVTDATQGVELATMRELARYWQKDYDWRKIEARLNALPQFTTKIDGLDIHFIHVRSKNRNALPVIITHGWPGSGTSSATR